LVLNDKQHTVVTARNGSHFTQSYLLPKMSHSTLLSKYKQIMCICICTQSWWQQYL